MGSVISLLVSVSALAVPGAATSPPASEQASAPRATSFPDVPPGHPFGDDIAWMADADISVGFPDGTFAPDTTVSRQAMAAFMHRLWLLLGGQPVDVPPPGFSDVGPSHPFGDAIAWMASVGITTGFDDGTFRPSAPVSRQAMSAFMLRLWVLVGGTVGSPPDPGFADVAPTHPFFDEIAWMASTGITTGYDDDTFRPSAPVRRQAMAAFMWRLFDLHTGAVCSTQTQIPLSECTALVALHLGTRGHLWAEAIGWMSTTTPCSWLGVTCTSVPAAFLGRGAPMTVTEIELGTNTMTGRLPTQIDSLASLELLDLRRNRIGGAIPDDITALARLRYLNVSFSLLAGPLPDGIGNMAALEILLLGGNRLEGPIPASLASSPSLIGVNLVNNQLSGSIPGELGNLPLMYLYLQGNRFEGAIPPELAVNTGLLWLTLSGNQLTGPIPASFGNFTQIQTMHLNDNQLSGPVPASFANLTTLTNLMVKGNGCLTASPTLSAFLAGHDPDWNDGCP